MLSGKSTNDVDIEMRRFPYPSYADDKFLVALQGWLPLIIMLSFIYPALNIVKSVVHEKERRLKVRYYFWMFIEEVIGAAAVSTRCSL